MQYPYIHGDFLSLNLSAGGRGGWISSDKSDKSDKLDKLDKLFRRGRGGGATWCNPEQLWISF